MDLAYIAYLLFVIPGFCLVWTYCHFTKARILNDFEYASWSLISGTLLFLLFGLLQKFNPLKLFGIDLTTDITFSPSDPFALMGSLLGVSLALATLLSFPLGYGLAYLSHKGFFRYFDRRLFKFLEKSK